MELNKREIAWQNRNKIYNSIKTISDCFPNVFLASERFDVRWSRFSNLQPDITCMKDLLKYEGQHNYNYGITPNLNNLTLTLTLSIMTPHLDTK